MDEILYIVVYRTSKTGKWTALCDGEMPERRMAENLIEIKKHQVPSWEFAIVEGPITNPAEMAEQEAALGQF